MPGSKTDLPAFPRLGLENEERTEIDTELRFTLRIGHKPWFFVVGGRTSLGRLIEVRDKMIIGRAPPADVVLDEEGLSRRHARIDILQGGVIRITDLDSRNGIRVAGRRTKVHPIRDGERIRLGDAVLTLIHFDDNTELLMRNMRASIESNGT